MRIMVKNAILWSINTQHRRTTENGINPWPIQPSGMVNKTYWALPVHICGYKFTQIQRNSSDV